MFNNMTISRLDNVSHRARSKGKKTVQCTHCAVCCQEQRQLGGEAAPLRKLAASAGAGADNAEGGLVTMWNTMSGMSTRTMPAMFGDGELVSVIEGNLLGRSRGLKRVENGSNMSSLKFIFLPNVCGLWQD